jgi:hypothetical protein
MKPTSRSLPVLLALASLLTVATGCGAAGSLAEAAAASPSSPQAPSAQSQMAYPKPSAMMPSAPMAPGMVKPGVNESSPAPAPPAPPASPTGAAASVTSASLRAPLIIYSGQMSLSVQGDGSKAIESVLAVSESLGGYLSSRSDNALQVRVPSARFQEAMTKVGALGEVTHRHVSTSDVSDEFHDVEVRLANLRATRTRLQELLSRSGSLVETLTVERELERVTRDIDQIEGRLEYLKSHVAFSTLDVTVDARPRSDAVAKSGPHRFVDLPVKWLEEMGEGRLLTLH